LIPFSDAQSTARLLPPFSTDMMFNKN